MKVYLNKPSSNEDWEIKINFDDSEDEVDIIAVLDVISMASTNPSLYEKACQIIGDKYGEGVLVGLMSKSSDDETYEEDLGVDPNPMSSVDMKIDKEEALFILAEIPLVGNINLQP
jgi:hypothetical protein